MIFAPDFSSPTTRARSSAPHAFSDRIRSRARGCWPGSLDARSTPVEVRRLRQAARWARDLDNRGFPRYFAVLFWTVALTAAGIFGYLLMAGPGTQPVVLP